MSLKSRGVEAQSLGMNKNNDSELRGKRNDSESRNGLIEVGQA